MSSARLAVAATTPESAPLTPICVRSRSLDVQANDAQSSQKPALPQESPPSPYAAPSFAINPALCGRAVCLSDSPNVITMSSPDSVLRLAIVPPQFQAGGAIRLLSQQYVHSVNPRVDPRMLQRSHSEYGPAVSSHLYNYQLAASGQKVQSMEWSARDLVLRSPPLPRQRSAKACKKCRKRKTKCSGSQPCMRCIGRGLECEYDEKSTLRGPLKSRTESRRKLSPKTTPTHSTDSRSSSQAQDTEEDISGDASSHLDKIPSVMQPAPGAHISPRDEIPQLYIVHTIATSGLIDSTRPRSDPVYVRYVAGESVPGSAIPHGCSVSDDSGGSSLIQGYVAADGQDSVELSSPLPNDSWTVATGDASRPPSACSVYSYSSSDASGYTLSSDASLPSSASSSHSIAWPTVVSEYGISRALPRVLSSSASSSSLRDALVERPRRRAISQASSLAAPVSTISGAADALTSVLSHASLTGSECVACATAETSLMQGSLRMPSLLSSTGSIHERSPLAWDTVSRPPTPASALKFEDVFNFAADRPDTMDHGGGGFEALESRSNTIKARRDVAS